MHCTITSVPQTSHPNVDIVSVSVILTCRITPNEQCLRTVQTLQDSQCRRKNRIVYYARQRSWSLMIWNRLRRQLPNDLYILKGTFEFEFESECAMKVNQRFQISWALGFRTPTTLFGAWGSRISVQGFSLIQNMKIRYSIGKHQHQHTSCQFQDFSYV